MGRAKDLDRQRRWWRAEVPVQILTPIYPLHDLRLRYLTLQSLSFPDCEVGNNTPAKALRED